jgi:hypothetical protein
MKPVTNEQLRKLLLRQLPTEEVAQVEEAILREEGVAERLREEEFDLIDDYVRGKLAATERADMERYVLTTPEHIESLQVARALAAPRTEALVRPKWRGRRALPLGALLAAGLAAVVVIPHWGVHRGTSSPPAMVSAALPSVEPVPDQTLTLLADTRRGGSMPLIRLTSDAVTVRLQTEVPGPPRNAWYSIRMDDAAGRTVFEKSHLTTHVAGPYTFVEASVPVEAFGSGVRNVSLTVDGAAATAAPDYRWQINTVRESTAQKK